MSEALQPLYWMHERTGLLRPIVLKYIQGIERLTDAEVDVLRYYLQQWIDAPGWQGSTLATLRKTIRLAKTQTMIREWLHEAELAGHDPL